jgi:hypothetical protein
MTPTLAAQPTPELPDARFVQKRLWLRTRFEFVGDQLHYELRRPSGSRSMSIECGAVDFDTGHVVTRSATALAAAVLATLTGCGALIAAPQGLVAPLWFAFAAVAGLVYWFTDVRAVLLFSERGEMRVLENGDQDAILAELEKRRRDQLRHWHAQIDFGNDPDREIEKFRWLQSHAVITETELEERISAIAQSAPLYETGYPEDVLH